MSNVPCNGCVLCCQNEQVILRKPHDQQFVEWYVVKVREGKLTLANKVNGDCAHLSPDRTGCTIYDKRPLVCRRFDCRRSAKDPNTGMQPAVRARGLELLANG